MRDRIIDQTATARMITATTTTARPLLKYEPLSNEFQLRAGRNNYRNNAAAVSLIAQPAQEAQNQSSATATHYLRGETPFKGEDAAAAQGDPSLGQRARGSASASEAPPHSQRPALAATQTAAAPKAPPSPRAALAKPSAHAKPAKPSPEAAGAVRAHITSPGPETSAQLPLLPP